MDEKDVEKLLEAPVSGDLLGDAPSNVNTPKERVAWTLTTLINKSVDDRMIPNKRRGAYVILKILLRRMDKAVQNLPPPTENHSSNTDMEASTPISVSLNKGLLTKNITITGNRAEPTPDSRRGNPVVGKPCQNGSTPVNLSRRDASDANKNQKPSNSSSSVGQHQSRIAASTTTASASRPSSAPRNTTNGAPPRASPPGGSAAASSSNSQQQQAPLRATRFGNQTESQRQNPSRPAMTAQSQYNSANKPAKSSEVQPNGSAQKSATTAEPQPNRAAKKTPIFALKNPLAVTSKSVPPATTATLAAAAAASTLPATSSSRSPIKALSVDPRKASGQAKKKVAVQQRLPPPPLVLPPIPLPVQPKTIKLHSKWFPEAATKFTGALEARPNSKLTWRGGILKDEEIMSTMKRLYMWEPYWEMLDVLALTKTTPIEKVEHADNQKNAPKPSRASEVSFPVPLNYQKLIPGWNTPKYGNAYKHGEVRLLFRMVPENIPQKPKTAKKKLRSDYHLWPKGTFCQVDGKAIEIVQRKQQAHDFKEWKGMARFLDVTPHVKTPETIRLNAITQDDESYYLCAAICQFRAPDQLYHTLMNENSIEKLTVQESIQLALEYAEENMVCLVDDDVDHDDSAPSSFLFKLTCSISSTLMKTPVRARQCKHFQCFDLLNFLQSNVFVSGTRWECPVCNDEVISVYDLQHCALTQKMLKQYNPDASSFRDRVEFFSDGTWKLMAEKRKRYTNKKGKADEAEFEHEIIEL